MAQKMGKGHTKYQKEAKDIKYGKRYDEIVQMKIVKKKKVGRDFFCDLIFCWGFTKLIQVKCGHMRGAPIQQD